MKTSAFTSSLAFLSLATLLSAGGQFPINFREPLNQLTEPEKADSWTLFFNGLDLQGWEPQ